MSIVNIRVVGTPSSGEEAPHEGEGGAPPPPPPPGVLNGLFAQAGEALPETNGLLFQGDAGGGCC